MDETVWTKGVDPPVCSDLPVRTEPPMGVDPPVCSETPVREAGRRVRLVLWIPDESPLREGCLPLEVLPGSGGIRIKMDALGCAALLASAGCYLPLDQVLAWFAFLRGKARAERRGR